MIPSKETLDILAVIMYAAMVPYLILGIRNTIRHYIRNGKWVDAILDVNDRLPGNRSDAGKSPLTFGILPSFVISLWLPLLVIFILISWFILIPLALTIYLIVRYSIQERKKVEFLEQLKGESND